MHALPAVPDRLLHRATRGSRLALWISAIACLWIALAPRSFAQVAAPGDAQKSADVRRLLANDDAVAQLKQQLATRAISNIDYTKQLQDLTKARTEILARYDRVGQRDLTALYNAAKKDVALAAADAKKKAAADAQARAVADREAKKQAAVRDAEAKVEATRQAAAAQIKAVEDDAQAYTRLVLEHDQLVFKEGMLTLAPAERSKMPVLSAQGAEIKKKYAAGGPSAARNGEFQKRLTELSQELVQPAAKRWATDAFPDPPRVVADFSPESKRAAALVYLTRLLGERIAAPHRLKGRVLWFINLGTWGVGYFALAMALTGSPLPSSSKFWSDLPMAGTIMVAIASALYVGVLKIIVQIIRNSQFNSKYVPEFRRLLQESTPDLLKRFSSVPSPS